jgi:hypothetical protein
MKSVSIQLSFGARKRVQQQCGVKHKYRRWLVPAIKLVEAQEFTEKRWN